MTDARELIGCMYTLGGNAPEEGFDCYGLLKYTRAHYFGLATPYAGARLGDGVSNWEDFPAITRGVVTAAASGDWERVDIPGNPGDCVLLGRRRVNPPTHVGVALPHGVLHAFRGESGEGGSVVLTPWQYLEYAFHRVEVWRCSQRCS